MSKKYDPYINFAGLDRLQQELGRIFNLDEIIRDDVTNGAAAAWKPAVDIRDSDQQYIIYADIPGVDPDKIEISLKRGVLSISGERLIDRQSDEELQRVERRVGHFMRQFTLPDTADESSVNASSQHGVLTVTIDKKASEVARTIKVVSG